MCQHQGMNMEKVSTDTIVEALEHFIVVKDIVAVSRVYRDFGYVYFEVLFREREDRLKLHMRPVSEKPLRHNEDFTDQQYRDATILLEIERERISTALREFHG